MSKAKIKDTQPKARIFLDEGEFTKLKNHFGVAPNTIRKYVQGAALTPESKARAKEVREYALNELNAFYAPK